MTILDEKFFHAEITRRVDFAPDLWMVRLRAGGEFKFVPGQYATLGVEHNGKRVERPYSIVSSPAEEEVEFFFELVPEGALTPLLHKLQPGDQLSMRKVPKGKFTLDTQNGRTNHLLISTVTGVAPFVSFVRTLHKDWKEGRFDGAHKLFLLNGASRPWEFGYLDELNQFDKELQWFKYVPTVSRPMGSCGLVGRNRSRRRHPAQICRSLGTRCEQHHGLHLRASGNDRTQQGNPEAPRVHRPSFGQRRSLLDSGEVVRCCAQRARSRSSDQTPATALRRSSSRTSLHRSPILPMRRRTPTFAEAARLVQCNAGGVLWKNPGLQCPDSVQLRFEHSAPAGAPCPSPRPRAAAAT